MVLFDLVCRFSSFLFKSTAILLIAPASLWAQLHSFDLDAIPADDFKDQAPILFKGIGLSIGNHPLFSSDPQNRLKLSASLSRPVYLENNSLTDAQEGLVPMIDVGFLVTSNLIITGKLVGFGSSNDVVHVTSYGGILFLSGSEERETWAVNVNNSFLRGPEDIFIRTSDILMRRLYRPLSIPVQLGFGTNLYSGKGTSGESSGRFTGQTNYFYLGSSLPLPLVGQGEIHLNFNQDLVQVTVGIVREFK